MVLKPLNIVLNFHGNLAQLLRKGLGSRTVYSLTRRASIKDIIESCGVPHTEVGRISLGKVDIDFYFIPGADVLIDIVPVSTANMHSLAGLLLRPPSTKFRFMVDINVAKLAPLLRMLGLSADLLPANSVKELVQAASLVMAR